MVGTTLVDLREHIEALASADGEYSIVCGRTGDRPVPISGLRFDGRAAARSAARAAEQYRIALRRYDPQVACYDLIVCQDIGSVRPEQRQVFPKNTTNGGVDAGMGHQTPVPYPDGDLSVHPLLAIIARLDGGCPECQCGATASDSEELNR